MVDATPRGGLDWVPERVLCVSAHPDDSEFGYAATVARLVAEGSKVSYVVVTDGSQGGENPAVPGAELTATREPSSERRRPCWGSGRCASWACRTVTWSRTWPFGA